MILRSELLVDARIADLRRAGASRSPRRARRGHSRRPVRMAVGRALVRAGERLAPSSGTAVATH